MDWINLKDRFPKDQETVLVSFLNSLGKRQIALAAHVSRRTLRADDYMSEDCYAEDFDYEEETDTQWTPEGWYEYQYNNDAGSPRFSETITHYMPTPK